MPHRKAKNLGNQITRRAFTDDLGVHPDRGMVLVRITNKARSTCYQYTEDMPPEGSGLPSPLHLVGEQVLALDELCREQDCPLDCAYEVASYALQLLAEARGAGPRLLDSTGQMNRLMKAAADANFLLKARFLSDLSPGERQEFSKLMRSVGTMAAGLAQEAEACADACERPAHAPCSKERARATG